MTTIGNLSDTDGGGIDRPTTSTNIDSGAFPAYNPNGGARKKAIKETIKPKKHQQSKLTLEKMKSTCLSQCGPKKSLGNIRYLLQKKVGAPRRIRRTLLKLSTSSTSNTSPRTSGFSLEAASSSDRKVDLNCLDHCTAVPLKGSPSFTLAKEQRNAKAKIATTSSGIGMTTSSASSSTNKTPSEDDYCYVVEEPDTKSAKLCSLATIILNAWRKKRNEARRLNEKNNCLKRGFNEENEQLQVSNALYHEEQNLHVELENQLKRSLEEANKIDLACQSLTTSLIRLQEDKALLEQKLEIKSKEFDGLNIINIQRNSDLFNAREDARELQVSLSSEQHKVQTVEMELLNQISELGNASLERQQTLRKQLNEKEEAFKVFEDRLNKLNTENFELQEKACALETSLERQQALKNETKNLRNEERMLQQRLAATLAKRLKAYWNASKVYQKTMFQVLHWVAYCIFTVAPVPHFPIDVTLQSFLKF